MHQQPYQYIPAPPGRTIVVGDIHGCFDELNTLLKTVGFSARDLLISVGDLVDRGPRSFEVVRFFMERDNAFAVAGNHERKVRRILEDGLDPGPMQTLTMAQVPEGERVGFHSYLQTLPSVIETPGVLVVHARLDPTKPKDGQELKFCSAVGGPSVTIPVDEGGVPLWYREWISRRDGEDQHTGPVKPICFGHLSYERVELVPGRLYALDTGAVAAGRLTAYLVDEREIVDIQVGRDYFEEARSAWQERLFRTTDLRTTSIRSVKRIGEPELIERLKETVVESGVYDRFDEIRRLIETKFGEMPKDGPRRGEHIRTVRGTFPGVPPRLVNLIMRERPVRWEDVVQQLPRESVESIEKALKRIGSTLR